MQFWYVLLSTLHAMKGPNMSVGHQIHDEGCFSEYTEYSQLKVMELGESYKNNLVQVGWAQPEFQPHTPEI